MTKLLFEAIENHFENIILIFHHQIITDWLKLINNIFLIEVKEVPPPIPPPATCTPATPAQFIPIKKPDWNLSDQQEQQELETKGTKQQKFAHLLHGHRFNWRLNEVDIQGIQYFFRYAV